jgi:hypothetical protein
MLRLVWWHAIFVARTLHTSKLACRSVDMQANAGHPGDSSQALSSCASVSAPTQKPVALGGALLPAGEPHFATSRVQSVKPGPLWGAFK